jgi:hypothetical protein
MNIGDLRKAIEDLPDSMDLVVCHGDRALHVCGLGTSMIGIPAKFADDSNLAVLGGPRVFEITTRDAP